MELRVLICGDRDWDSWEEIKKVIGNLPAGVIVMHGDYRGADKMAGHIAEQAGHHVEKFPADWDEHGKAAGPIRNLEMLNQHPDKVLAFHNDLSKSKSTAHTVEEARNRSIPVQVVKKEADE